MCLLPFRGLFLAAQGFNHGAKKRSVYATARFYVREILNFHLTMIFQKTRAPFSGWRLLIEDYKHPYNQNLDINVGRVGVEGYLIQ